MTTSPIEDAMAVAFRLTGSQRRRKHLPLIPNMLWLFDLFPQEIKPNAIGSLIYVVSISRGFPRRRWLPVKRFFTRMRHLF